MHELIDRAVGLCRGGDIDASGAMWFSCRQSLTRAPSDRPPCAFPGPERREWGAGGGSVPIRMCDSSDATARSPHVGRTLPPSLRVPCVFRIRIGSSARPWVTPHDLSIHIEEVETGRVERPLCVLWPSSARPLLRSPITRRPFARSEVVKNTRHLPHAVRTLTAR